MFDSVPKRVASLFWKIWYPLLTWLTRNGEVTFLNYGYAALDDSSPRLGLQIDDEPNRPCIQLYNRIAGSIPLQGLRVLEVSCGHGGGASYVARYLSPASMHGMDRNPSAVALCLRKHHVPNLSFSTGDALALDVADDSFDVVLNVEASHCYSDMPRFLSEVQRVLCPGGYLLYADFRRRDPDSAQLRQQIAQSGLEVVREDDITANVLRGMQLNTPAYLALIRRLAPLPLRHLLKSFSGVAGSSIYRSLESGESVYLMYVLRKQSRSDHLVQRS